MLQKFPFTDMVFHFKSTGSTMNDASKLLSGLRNSRHNFLIIADEQTGGLGRNKNQWLSPQGGLWFTYCITETNITHQVTLFLGWCLYKVLTYHFPDLVPDLRFKWPNDLLLEGKKLSGILVQGQQDYLSIGIGINTNLSNIEIDSWLQPISLRDYLDFEVSNIDILNSFLNLFNRHYNTYITEGIAFYRKEINSLLFGIDRKIEFDTEKEVINGKLRGISDSGAILIEHNDGIITHYYSGSIISFAD